MSSRTSTTSSTSPKRRETSFIEPSGGLLTEQLIYKLRDEACSEDAVKPGTFAHPGEETPTTEAELEARIGEVWEDLEERWDEVTRGYELYAMDVSEAREKWMLKLFEALGFDPVYQRENLKADEIEANLSHLGWEPQGSITADIDGPESTPPVLHAIRPDEDRPLDDGKHLGAEGRNQSPHDELQRYLNSNEDVQWSVVTDGLTLRLLRDYYHTYTRGYIEFDLENIFTERNYDDFRALYRLCHASRFTPSGEADDDDDEEVEPPVEQLYQVALSTGVKVGQDLQSNIVSAIETLGNGFLDTEIKTALKEGGQDAAEDYYQDLLYVVYRLLFLLFAEQKGMMSQRDSLYTEEYSVSKLRKRAENYNKTDRNDDLWEGLKTSFRLVGEGDNTLGVPGYNGDLFDDDNLVYILDAQCPNEKLLSAVHDITHIEQEGYPLRISYADLGVEEIGAVYESLLEFTPQIAETVIELEDRTIPSDSFYLDGRGMDRKETGSYYTDPGLIQQLIQSALEPTVDDRLNEADEDVDSQEEALLDISVCDPACGSGAFLIAANNYLGQRLAKIRTDSPYPDEQTISHARRSVVQHCIYGVDKNPMAVELAKVSLWINSAVEDKPLSFLDHRIRQGNSLIGTTPELISEGVPDDAFETSKGREYHVGTDIRRLVRKESKKVQSELTWYSGDRGEYVSLAEKLDQLEEDNIEDIHEKERLYRELRDSDRFRCEMLAHDVWTAAFYWPLDEYQTKIKASGKDPDEYLEANQDEFPTPKTIEKIRRELPNEATCSLSELSGLELLRERAERIAERESFFHWTLEFPKVFSGDGGFDCILGNPPWDKLTIEETKFFAISAPHIADSALTQSERQNLIDDLEEENPDLYQDYQDATKRVRNQKNFIKYSGRFPLSSHGIINLYAPFAELSLNEIGKEGASGIVVPTGIATDSNTQDYFREIVEKKRLASLYDFENKKGIFPDVHKQYKFCLLTLFGNEVPQDRFELAFYLTEIEHLNSEDKKYTLAPDDIQAVNPNTGNCPTFRERADADLTVDIYKQNSILKYEDEDRDSWGVDLRRMFNSGDDSGLFERKWDLEDEGWNLQGNIFEKSGEDHRYLPIYESKMLHQHDHRFATYAGADEESIKKKQPRELEDTEKDDETLHALPPYWVSEEEYTSKWEFDDEWHLVLRKVTNATNRRTVIASVIPAVATEDSVNHILHCNAEKATLLLACLNSYVLDYAARQKVGGENLNQYIAEQLPIPDPKSFDQIQIDEQPVRDVIVNLTLRLMYTAEDIKPFAHALDSDIGPYSFTAPNTRKREEVRFELEALLCHVYSMTSDGFDQLFSTFEQIKRQDEHKYGYYRTRDEIKKRFIEISSKIIDTSEKSQ
jgi:hypothetical protein